jgi:hypothetical protein
MGDFRADLHCHTTCSDGSDSPLEILHKAKRASLQGLSITDHDTIDAYTPEFFALAETLSLRILPGVEISAEHEGISVHVLGYGFDLKSPSFLTFLSEMRSQRAKRNQEILKKLAAKKMRLDEAEFSHRAMYGRPHIAAKLVEKGYVGSFQEAFELYLKEGASCYVPGFHASVVDAVKQIRLGGGKAVLSHPHFYKSRSLLSCSFDGIECYYAYFPKEVAKPWLELAKKRGWIATGGSDYHGTIKNNRLGSSWVNEEIFNALGSVARDAGAPTQDI